MVVAVRGGMESAFVFVGLGFSGENIFLAEELVVAVRLPDASRLKRICVGVNGTLNWRETGNKGNSNQLHLLKNLAQLRADIHALTIRVVIATARGNGTN